MAFFARKCRDFFGNPACFRVFYAVAIGVAAFAFRAVIRNGQNELPPIETRKAESET